MVHKADLNRRRGISETRRPLLLNTQFYTCNSLLCPLKQRHRDLTETSLAHIIHSILDPS